MKFAHSFLMYCGMFLLAVSLVMPSMALAEGLPGNGGDEEDENAAPCLDTNCAACTQSLVTCPRSGARNCGCACNQKKECKA